MDKLSGLILDTYDDQQGAVMKSIFPTLEDVPEIVKTAHQVTPEERDQLPDDVFALILHDNDVTLRKYACIDEGNTCLSIEYFLKTAHKLPEEAQQVAAANFMVACSWYGIDPPEELEKIAIPIMPLVAGALVIPEANRQTKANLKAVRSAGGAVMTPEQMKARVSQQTV